MGAGRRSVVRSRLLYDGRRDDRMNRQDVLRDMKKEIGSFPNISQIARYMSVSRDKAREMVSGLEYLEDGRSRKYFINNVADRILQQRTM